MDRITDNKIQTLENLLIQVENFKKEKKIVFTNGCFDLIHIGHTRYLREARGFGDLLIVAVNSDRSVKELKGENRPIVTLSERLEILAGFYFINFVLEFDELTPLDLIEKIIPQVLVKGGDWAIDNIVGKNVVEKHGGVIKTIPEIPGSRTSSIIDQMIRNHNQS